MLVCGSAGWSTIRCGRSGQRAGGGGGMARKGQRHRCQVAGMAAGHAEVATQAPAPAQRGAGHTALRPAAPHTAALHAPAPGPTSAPAIPTPRPPLPLPPHALLAPPASPLAGLQRCFPRGWRPWWGCSSRPACSRCTGPPRSGAPEEPGAGRRARTLLRKDSLEEVPLGCIRAISCMGC